MKQQDLKNEKVKNYSFLQEMYQDGYFPDFLVDKGKEILVNLCFQIEEKPRQKLDDFYKLTHQVTKAFNKLAEEFEANDSEIETVARDCIGVDFFFIANAYNYKADIEELIAPRDW